MIDHDETETADDSPAASPAAPLQTVEHWAREGCGPERPPLAVWQFRAVKAFHRWPDGRELTAAAFTQAVSDALGAVIR